jgi:serine/threonine-protein kinase HipA
MGRHSHTRALDLWMNGAFVGTWRLHPVQGDVLAYASEWVAAREGRPLSLSLPFLPGNAPHRGPAVRAWFDNLLPDSQDIRNRIARRFQSGATDAFSLLAQIGRDCVGALQIMPEGEAPSDVRTVDATVLYEHDVAALLRATVAPSPLQDTDDFRISIAGAQEKTAVLLVDGLWYRPHGSTPTTHILKLPLGLVGNMGMDMRDSVENEWLCAQILHEYGLPVARCAPLQFEDQKVLGVERFDRQWHGLDGDSPWLLRLPQEDMCQATGTPPLLKYEADGGPGIGRIMGILDGSSERDRDQRRFFQAQVLFWMLCATDGHAKNFSLRLAAGGRYDMTPLYDVLSAYPLLGKGARDLSPFAAKMAMAVRATNPHWKMREITRRHWLAVAQRHGVQGAAGQPAPAILDELVAQTPGVIAAVSAQLPAGFPAHVAERIFQGLQAAAIKLAT